MGIEEFGADWLDGVEPENQEQPEAKTEEVQPEPVVEQPQEQEQPAEPNEPQEQTQVPLAKLVEERKARQDAERRLRDLESRQQAEPVKPQPIPDAYEDPEGFNRYQDQRFAQTEWNIRASMSERFAKQQHGEAAVNEATEWGLERAKGDPGFAQKVMSDPDPVGFTMREYQQSKTLETLAGRNFEDAAKDYAISQGWIVSQPGDANAPLIQKPLQSTAKPAIRSLAQAPGTGSAPANQGNDFGDVFASNGMGLRK